MTTVKKTAAPRRPKTIGADQPSENRVVVTTEGTVEIPEVSDSENLKEVTVVEESKFVDLSTDELRSVAEFFLKDFVEGAGRKELLAALESREEDSEPVTWDDYINLYTPNQPSSAVNTPQVEAGNPLVNATSDKENNILVFMERKNPRYDIGGYTFTHDHPFNSVPEKTAEYICGQKGFRLALPSEVTEYYA